MPFGPVKKIYQNDVGKSFNIGETFLKQRINNDLASNISRPGRLNGHPFDVLERRPDTADGF
jgi:hypothetical protein